MSSHCFEELWSHPGKGLRDHLQRVAESAQSLMREIPMNFPEGRHFPPIAYIVGAYHDLGKATPFFQTYLREDDPDKRASLANKPETKHSLISAVAAYIAVSKYLEEHKVEDERAYFLSLISFIAVRRHHTNLRDIRLDLRLEGEDVEVLSKQVDHLPYDRLDFLPYWSYVRRELKGHVCNWPLRGFGFTRRLRRLGEGGALPYLQLLLLYSVLLEADKREAAGGLEPQRRSVPVEVIDEYRRIVGYDAPATPIDRLRNDLYRDVLDGVSCLDIAGEKILLLSAPTGLGKTMAALGGALRLRERIRKEKGFLPRIVYSLPFLSIIDQNARVIEEMFRVVTGKDPSSELLLVHHHLADYTYKGEGAEYGPDQGEVLVEGWDSEIVVTTFVQLFHTMFSNKNRALRKFSKLLGGIVILDEVQSFPHTYWLLFRKVAEAMATYFDTYFILSTATQPLIFDNPKELVPEKENYFRSLERSSIVVDCARERTVAEFADELKRTIVTDRRDLLVVLNTVRAAEELFKELRHCAREAGYQVTFLSSHVVPAQRLERIDEIRKGSASKKLVVSTQLIEAGVDIDMEKVIRDLGPLDCINQVAGRANRNDGTRRGVVEVVKLVDDVTHRPFCSFIYDATLIDKTQRLLGVRAEIGESGFIDLSQRYYRELSGAISDDHSKRFLDRIGNLEVEEVGRFELIEEDVPKVDVFIELDERASSVWEQYLRLLELPDPWSRRRGFLQLRREFYSYVVSIPEPRAWKNLPPVVGGMCYVPRTQLDEYYDLETGFKSEGGFSSW